MKSRGREGPRLRKKGAEPFPASWCHLTVPLSGGQGREVGKGVFRCIWFLVPHTTSFSLTRFHCNSREYSLRHLSHKARASPRTGTCPWVTGCSVALTSRVWTDGHVHSIFTMPYGWRSGVHTRPHGDGMAPANVTGWV